eukprot:930764_1
MEPQIEASFYVDSNESVIYYNAIPTVDDLVPYINAFIDCNDLGVDDYDVCYIHCIGSASCLLATVIPSSKSIERILIKCDKKFACTSMMLNYTESLSPNLHTIAIECSAPFSCSDHSMNFGSHYMTLNDLSVSIYCLESLSCESTTIDIQESFVSSDNFEMNVNVYCVTENSCKQLSIVNAHNENINIHLWSFEYSEGIKIKTLGAGYDLVHFHCGNDQDSRYLRYDTSDLLNEEELLTKAREEYTAHRLPCEEIEITCSNIVDFEVYEQQCSMRYELSDLVDITHIIKSDRNCFWININQLYMPQCDGSCGQNVTIYEYMISVELDMVLGINADDRDELYEFYKNDTSALNIDEIVCDEYFGDANLTRQTLTNVDAIIAAALRFYKENNLIHDSGHDVYSQIINGSMNCEGFDMQNNVILINSTFSVQSISPNRDDVDVFFAPHSLFHGEINNLFSEYFGEGMIPIFVAKVVNSTLSPSIDPTPGPTRS